MSDEVASAPPAPAEPAAAESAAAESAAAEIAELTRALRGAPPAPVAALPPEVLRRLTAQIDAGRRHHRAVADQAIAMATKGVPLPVRGIVRKALT